MFGLYQFLFIITFLPTFRWFPRNTVTLIFHQSLVEFGGTCRMPMHVMNSPTPVRQTERLNWPIRTWPSDWANEHQPSSDSNNHMQNWWKRKWFFFSSSWAEFAILAQSCNILNCCLLSSCLCVLQLLLPLCLLSVSDINCSISVTIFDGLEKNTVPLFLYNLSELDGDSLCLKSNSCCKALYVFVLHKLFLLACETVA